MWEEEGGGSLIAKKKERKIYPLAENFVARVPSLCSVLRIYIESPNPLVFCRMDFLLSLRGYFTSPSFLKTQVEYATDGFSLTHSLSRLFCRRVF